MRRPVIGVMGGHQASELAASQAEQLGHAIAQAGYVLLTGGRDEGIMAAATKGARDAGGLTIGLHPGASDDGDVADADVIIFTGIGFARNMCNVLSSDVVVCLPGSFGTLSEAAYARTYGKPIIIYGFQDNEVLGNVVRVDSLQECMAAIAEALD